MPQSLEIEFKNMLTKTEYETLLQYFKYHNTKSFKQQNIYLDTLDEALAKNKASLRARVTDHEIELTLKQIREVGNMETTNIITKDELKQLLEHQVLKSPEIHTILQNIGIDEPVYEIASLTTYRTEVTYQNTIIAIDQSTYYGKIDYEIELETDDYVYGRKVFETILSQFSIEKKKALHKVVRAKELKKSLTS